MLLPNEADALRSGAGFGGLGISRRWLDYFSPAKPLLGSRKNQAISANAESFSRLLPYRLLQQSGFLTT